MFNNSAEEKTFLNTCTTGKLHISNRTDISTESATCRPNYNVTNLYICNRNDKKFDYFPSTSKETNNQLTKLTRLNRQDKSKNYHLLKHESNDYYQCSNSILNNYKNNFMHLGTYSKESCPFKELDQNNQKANNSNLKKFRNKLSKPIKPANKSVKFEKPKKLVKIIKFKKTSTKPKFFISKKLVNRKKFDKMNQNWSQVKVNETELFGLNNNQNIKQEMQAGMNMKKTIEENMAKLDSSKITRNHKATSLIYNQKALIAKNNKVKSHLTLPSILERSSSSTISEKNLTIGNHQASSGCSKLIRSMQNLNERTNESMDSLIIDLNKFESQLDLLDSNQRGLLLKTKRNQFKKQSEHSMKYLIENELQNEIKDNLLNSNIKDKRHYHHRHYPTNLINSNDLICKSKCNLNRSLKNKKIVLIKPINEQPYHTRLGTIMSLKGALTITSRFYPENYGWAWVILLCTIYIHLLNFLISLNGLNLLIGHLLFDLRYNILNSLTINHFKCFDLNNNNIHYLVNNQLDIINRMNLSGLNLDDQMQRNDLAFKTFRMSKFNISQLNNLKTTRKLLDYGLFYLNKPMQNYHSEFSNLIKRKQDKIDFDQLKNSKKLNRSKRSNVKSDTKLNKTNYLNEPNRTQNTNLTMLNIMKQNILEQILLKSIILRHPFIINEDIEQKIMDQNYLQEKFADNLKANSLNNCGAILLDQLIKSINLNLILSNDQIMFQMSK